MTMLEGLRFTSGSSLLHKMDPRVKFFMTSVLFLATILFSSLLPMMIIFFIQIPLLVVSKVYREWLRTLRGASLLCVIIFSTNLLANYFYLGQVLTSETLEISLSMTLRFLVLITVFSVFFLTTSPDRLSLALERSRVPYELCFAFITAIRFVPVLSEEAQTIMDAQKARGLELEKGNFIKRIRNYLPILLPLIINSIRRSLDLAEAMESRAFGAVKNRTDLYDLRLMRSDYYALTLSAAGLVLLLWIRFFLSFPTLLFPSFRIA